ncbi:DUF1653 domain-containing protein [Megasphaera elsdenii]|uniref:DUF1653 domain-containing protein n=1 Tax=Megasphaera elsdenii TaxID=907 RepID=UPI00242AC08E|nr:DUF1653 domain-containing protein [Megasphaera elsdenii]
MIDDKMAKMAVNTLKKYCNTSFKTCNKCAVKDACCMPCRVFGNMNEINDVGTFESWRKPSERPPKFDIRQKDSADFQKYINEIFLREAEKYGLPMNTANSIKWSTNGKIKVTFVDNDTTYVGVAKCHPNDAFNPEIGIKLAIERAAQVMHAMNDMNKYERTIPKAGEKWMHFKGHVYEIIGFGNHTERMELVVIYHEAGDCTYWVRPLEKFMSKVDHNKYPDVPYKWRFWKVSDAEQ